MNVQMRIITEDNVDSLTSLQESDNIVRLTKFNNLTEIANENKKRILESEKEKFFEDTNNIVEQEEVSLFKVTDDGDWEQQDELPKMPVNVEMDQMNVVQMITIGDISVMTGETVKIRKSQNYDNLLNTMEDGLYNVIEILQDKSDPINNYRIRLENTEDGTLYTVNNILKIVKLDEPDAPESPNYDPISPTEDDLNVGDEFLEENKIKFERANKYDEEEFKNDEEYLAEIENEFGEESSEDESENEKKEKITIINEGEVDNKDLEILSPPNLNEGDEGRDDDIENDNSGIKKGIKIDL
tara:strand:- start:305 stop:1201 length:897 start_codon:yes stop_codon:yes gene_type:complete